MPRNRCCCCAEQRDPDVSFFRFPTDEIRKKEWIDRLGLVPESIGPTTIVCDKHFRHNQFEGRTRFRLKKDALPMRLTAATTDVDATPASAGSPLKNSTADLNWSLASSSTPTNTTGMFKSLTMPQPSHLAASSSLVSPVNLPISFVGSQPRKATPIVIAPASVGASSMANTSRPAFHTLPPRPVVVPQPQSQGKPLTRQAAVSSIPANQAASVTAPSSAHAAFPMSANTALPTFVIMSSPQVSIPTAARPRTPEPRISSPERKLRELKRKLQNTQKQLRNASKKSESLPKTPDEKLKHLFGHDQRLLKFVSYQYRRSKNPNNTEYTEEEREMAYAVYCAAGGRGYRLLREMGLHFPSQRALNRWSENLYPEADAEVPTNSPEPKQTAANTESELICVQPSPSGKSSDGSDCEIIEDDALFGEDLLDLL